MFESLVLETAIGLVFVYLIFSLIASAIAEYFSAILDRRGEHLKHILFNLFDNDDPQGRAFLNLFVAHPMVQALNSTAWKPKFQSALDRLGERKEQFALARTKWQAASNAVSAAGAALDAAKAAGDAAVKATAAAANVKTTLKTLTPTNPASCAAAHGAVADAETASAAALAAVTAADGAANAASAAEQEVKKARAAQPNGADTSAPGPTPRPVEPDQSLAAGEPVTAAGSPRAPAPEALQKTPAPAPGAPAPAPGPAGGDLEARANAVVDQASKAAAMATQAAKGARKAAAAAQKAKKGLDEDLIGLVTVPKYIPDRTFADVLIHVLTADETIRALSRNEAGDLERGPSPGTAVTTFWDRFGAALKVVGGVASRLPDNDVKTNVNRCITAIDESLRLMGSRASDVSAVVGQLEKGTNELRAAIAAVPDDALRSALEREIETSLRPLHMLGQDILMLERAGQAITMMADSSIKTALTAFVNQAGEDLDQFKSSLTSWYNDVMDHASGWYKRNTQKILIGIAVVLCVLNNVDTVDLVRHLSADRSLRASVVAAAEKTAKEGPESANKPTVAVLNQSLDDSRLPLWWTKESLSVFWPNETEVRSTTALKTLYRSPWLLGLVLKVLGLLISILAVSMGAPFWFDVLNKMVNVRLVGKRPETSVDGAAPAAVPGQGAGGAKKSPGT
ncbi:MAG: hypothetical protein ACHRXM_14100 [Isosphaerales bacterium]